MSERETGNNIRDRAMREAADMIMALLLARDAARASDPIATLHDGSNLVRDLIADSRFEQISESFGDDALAEVRQAMVERIDHIVDLADIMLLSFLQAGREEKP